MPGSTRNHSAHRKRHGHHQKRTTHFLKVYKPFLPLLLLVVITLGFVSTSTLRIGQKSSGTVSSNNTPVNTEQVLSYATNIDPGGLLAATNQRRSAAGLGGLSNNGKLAQAAQAKANDMAARNYWAHNTPDGSPPWVFINNAGYSYNRAGENLACGFNDSTAVITGWYNSPSHRDNLLGDYQDVGFGIANAAGYNCGDFPATEQTIVVAMYGTPYSPPASQPQAQTPAPSGGGPVATRPAVNSQATGSAAPTAESSQKHTVTLTITDKNNKASANTKVTLHSDPQTAITNKQGQVTFKDVETGKHTVIVEISGAKSETPIDLTGQAADFKMTIVKPELSSNQTTRDSSVIYSPAKPKKVSRIDLLINNFSLELTWLLVLLVLGGGSYVLVKHSIAAHKFFVKGERYMHKHKLVDIAVILLIIALYILTRNVGVIL